MTKEQINRINELAKKSKVGGLTDSEKNEQAKLRKLYVESFRESLVSQLENTYIVDEHGNKKKVQKKDKCEN
ncbi:MAG: DUF896 domain-containing protein [Clostridiales bacterium]|nr:DUF896 domain-containing protein [Clostridiales bacterium]